jgi:hypothetical protein
MSYIFHVDGRESRIEDIQDLQVELQGDLDVYENQQRILFDDLRGFRDSRLGASDWTQVSDGPLDSTTKTAWGAYRTKLRDLPADAKAPNQFASTWRISSS